MHSERIAVGIGAIIAVLLQIIVAPNIAFGSIVPNFLLAYVVVVAVTMARTCGLIMPFVLGLIFDFVGDGPVGAMALLFVLVAFVISRVFPRIDNDTLFIPIVVIIVSVLLVEIFYGVLTIACGLSVGVGEALVFRALPCTLYACVFAFIMYPLVVHFIARRQSQPTDIPFVS